MAYRKNVDRGDLIPPPEVAKCAAIGLEFHEKFNRGGTKVGWARARNLKDRKPLSFKDVNRISSYFARHEVDKNAENFGNDDNPSKGYIAWMLWGGDPGKKWVDELKKRLKKDE